MGAAASARPPWLDETLYPFMSRFETIEGSTVHYVDEGSGPTLLLLHGNPTWSFLYRDIIRGLRDRFRCIALDYPGFGLSRAAPGYGFTPAEHSRVLGEFVRRLDLGEITMMVQDWGGPIGFGVAIRQPERFARFVIGNTWAWPKTDLSTQIFSRLLGGPIGNQLIHRHNIFVERIIPTGVNLHPLPEAVMAAYRGPFPTPASRTPTYVFPREILRSRPFLEELRIALPVLRDRPALLVWPTRDFAFRTPERERWESLFEDHRTVLLAGASHYIQEEDPETIVTAIRDWTPAAAK
jgi:haloalkane dehalogenase